MFYELLIDEVFIENVLYKEREHNLSTHEQNRAMMVTRIQTEQLSVGQTAEVLASLTYLDWLSEQLL